MTKSNTNFRIKLWTDTDMTTKSISIATMIDSSGKKIIVAFPSHKRYIPEEVFDSMMAYAIKYDCDCDTMRTSIYCKLYKRLFSALRERLVFTLGIHSDIKDSLHLKWVDPEQYIEYSFLNKKDVLPVCEYAWTALQG